MSSIQLPKPIAPTLVPPPPRPPATPRPDLGATLLSMRALSVDELSTARCEALRLGISLDRLLLSRRQVSARTLIAARVRVGRALAVDLALDPPDPRLIDRIGARACLRLGIVPWRRVGAVLLVATDDPDHLRRLDLGGEAVLPVLAPRDEIRAALFAARGPALARAAETRVHPRLSCRDWPIRGTRDAALLLLAAALVLALAAPLVLVTLLLGWGLLAMSAVLGLKLAAGVLHLLRGPVRRPPPDRTVVPAPRPLVSVLVPLYRETEIAARLVKRLSRLTYPKELLEVCLVVEDDDSATRTALARAELPPWFTVVEVPQGSIRTKPRAMNYALDAAQGEVIGVWDAEDAPEADQIDRIVEHFRRAGPEVACLQGRLTWYNRDRNWLTRCFTVDYATWFRLVLPALQRIGWAIPLGGTSVFFRRAALERLGGWDAHNVTEDADLGLRLARAGYRTEIADTITYEEATETLWAWIRQRSRWLKGYAITYAVHMRSPRQLLRDLGAWRFLGVQTVFLASLSQFALAPMLWSFWPAAFGAWHPFEAVLPAGSLRDIAWLFLGAEAIALVIGVLAVAERGQRRLMVIVPTMLAYFPFATVALAKGLWELTRRPFFWDKTSHGMAPHAPKA